MRKDLLKHKMHYFSSYINQRIKISLIFGLISPLEQFKIFNIKVICSYLTDKLNFIFKFSSLLFFDISLINNATVFVTIAFLLIGMLIATQKNSTLQNSFLLTNKINFIKNTLLNYLPPQYLTLYFVFFWIFLIILGNNIIGLIPYSFAPTSYIFFTFFISFVLFVWFNLLSIKFYRQKSLVLFLPSGAPGLITPFLVGIEIISYVARVFSIAIRLFANILSGHALVHILTTFSAGLITLKSFLLLFISLLPLIVVLAILPLEMSISVLQAYVYLTLIAMYLGDCLSLHHSVTFRVKKFWYAVKKFKNKLPTLFIQQRLQLAVAAGGFPLWLKAPALPFSPIQPGNAIFRRNTYLPLPMDHVGGHGMYFSPEVTKYMPGGAVSKDKMLVIDTLVAEFVGTTEYTAPEGDTIFKLDEAKRNLKSFSGPRHDMPLQQFVLSATDRKPIQGSPLSALNLQELFLVCYPFFLAALVILTFIMVLFLEKMQFKKREAVFFTIYAKARTFKEKVFTGLDRLGVFVIILLTLVFCSKFTLPIAVLSIAVLYFWLNVHCPVSENLTIKENILAENIVLPVEQIKELSTDRYGTGGKRIFTEVAVEGKFNVANWILYGDYSIYFSSPAHYRISLITTVVIGLFMLIEAFGSYTNKKRIEVALTQLLYAFLGSSVLLLLYANSFSLVALILVFTSILHSAILLRKKGKNISDIIIGYIGNTIGLVFIIFGIFCIYSATGTTQLAELTAILKEVSTIPKLVKLGFMLIIFGFTFKLGIGVGQLYFIDAIRNANPIHVLFVSACEKILYLWFCLYLFILPAYPGFYAFTAEELNIIFGFVAVLAVFGACVGLKAKLLSRIIAVNSLLLYFFFFLLIPNNIRALRQYAEEKKTLIDGVLNNGETIATIVQREPTGANVIWKRLIWFENTDMGVVWKFLLWLEEKEMSVKYTAAEIKYLEICGYSYLFTGYTLIYIVLSVVLAIGVLSRVRENLKKKIYISDLFEKETKGIDTFFGIYSYVGIPPLGGFILKCVIAYGAAFTGYVAITLAAFYFAVGTIQTYYLFKMLITTFRPPYYIISEPTDPKDYNVSPEFARVVAMGFLIYILYYIFRDSPWLVCQHLFALQTEQTAVYATGSLTYTPGEDGYTVIDISFKVKDIGIKDQLNGN